MMKRLLIASAALLPAWTAAAGQEENRDLRIRVGLGAQVRPEFYGGDKSEAAPLWEVDIARGDDQFAFEAPDDGFAIPLVSEGGFSAGPTANLERSRTNSDVGAPVGKVKATIEAGVFAQYEASDSIRVRGEVRKGIGGHDGLVGSAGTDYIWRDGDAYVFSIGPRLLFSNARYQRAFFGVTSAAALATGLPAYRPDGGIHAIAATSGLSYQFTPDIGMFGFARYERLVGDAAKSPIVRQLGSRNQASAGVGLTYTFTVNR
ncbi:MAG TPA: MipA/OmpV family protein [Sphingomicrobium sp.]|nr:MipA/OmpV family protein [Sphingomicrobium sp.]